MDAMMENKIQIKEERPQMERTWSTKQAKQDDRHITVQFKNIKAKNIGLTKAQEGARAEPLQRTSLGPHQRHPCCKQWDRSFEG